MNTDWRSDPDNAQFYLETALEIVRQTKMGKAGAEFPNAFTLWAEKLLQGKRFIVLQGDQSFVIEGIAVDMHGDKGPNGARGSIKNLRRIGVRSVIGHSHSPGISEGAYQTGTSTFLRLEYNGGPSSWLNTHCAIYPNGKRTLISILNGKWRLRKGVKDVPQSHRRSKSRVKHHDKTAGKSGESEVAGSQATT